MSENGRERIGTDKYGAGAKFTPGPWEAGRNKAFSTVLDGKEGKAIYAGGNYHVGWANAWNENGEIDLERAVANATLMGAAPKMYAALCIVHDVMLDMGMLPDAVAAIEDVIKEARGER